jgi:hypothetical protein
LELRVLDIPYWVTIRAIELGLKRVKNALDKGLTPKNFDKPIEDAHIQGALGELMFYNIYPEYGFNEGIIDTANSIDHIIDGENYDLKCSIFHKPYSNFGFDCIMVDEDANRDKYGYIATAINNKPELATKFFIFGVMPIPEIQTYPTRCIKYEDRPLYMVPINHFIVP